MEQHTLPPLAIYIHVPWCIRKCPYCDFNSHASKVDDIPEVDYLTQIQRDIMQDAPLAQGRLAQSVFFGGGTPSLLSADAVAQIIRWLQDYIGLSNTVEITLEANPGTFEAAKFAGFRRAGVNRLSIGVQSFQDRFLSNLGRIHGSADATSAIKQAKAVGFDNLNIDLMHGLQDQTQALALADLNHAISLQPTHISWYQLTIEQNTEFYRQPPTLPEDDTLWDIQQAGQTLLAKEGFQQYEVSAYAKNNQRSEHNLNYWRYGDYLGIGPGAHGKYTQQTNKGVDIIRTRKTRLPKDYLSTDRPLARIEERVVEADRPFDYFINTLRIHETVSLKHFSAATGVPFKQIEPILSELHTKGWINWQDDKFDTTETGFLYLNDLLSYWLTE